MLLSVFFFRNSLQFKKVSLPLQPQTRNNGAIAQLVEQRTENPCVPGSIPGGTTLKKKKTVNIDYAPVTLDKSDKKVGLSFL